MITSTILTAVERQLTRYFSAMSQQNEATKQLAEQARDDMRRELDSRIPAIEELLRDRRAEEGSTAIDESYLTELRVLGEKLDSLRSATDQRLDSVAAAATAASEAAASATALAAVARLDEAQRATERMGTLETTLQQMDARAEELRVANEAYQAALQTALEERLGEFANHQHWRMNDIEDKIAALPTGIDAETMMEIRQTVRDDMERSFGSVHTRLDEIVNVNKRFDEQAAEHVQRVTDINAALEQRINEGDERTVLALEDRLSTLQTELNTTFEGIAEQVGEHATMLLGKIDSAESRGVDRLLELEGRIAEDLGTKIANLDATIGRVAGGFDDAMIALNQRLLELENKLYDFEDRMGAMAEELAKVDDAAMDEIRAEMSRAVGEATLVRIEFDRVVASTDEKIEKQTIRMSEIENLLVDHMDVSTSVQLERLDELERQMALVEAPPQIAAATAQRAAEAEAALRASNAEGGMFGGGDATSPSGTDRTPPSMSLNPRPNPADTSWDASVNGNDNDGTRETESTFSSH